MVAVINRDECVGCGTCVDDCPSEAIAMDGDNIAVVDADECLDCGACVDSCPTDAITME
ncbi:ATP-binding protein [Methanococcoides sp. FTZ1]|uniref:ATP-binding protein n=1 Tax=Methanococcoides sp. FTZ1 TaxID=3439061 RepID=UPI003F87F693